MENNGDTVLRIISEGHVVALRTHQPLTELLDEEITEAILYPSQFFREHFGRPIDPFLRPSEGAYSEHTLSLTRHYGFYSVFWSVQHYDWTQAAAYVHPGMILFLSDINEANVQALNRLIAEIQDAGYSFASLYELI
jgi:peptidoglycan/xylan/chitin deacetylase (PgdA/CDA1 family)